MTTHHIPPLQDPPPPFNNLSDDTYYTLNVGAFADLDGSFHLHAGGSMTPTFPVECGEMVADVHIAFAVPWLWHEIRQAVGRIGRQ